MIHSLAPSFFNLIADHALDDPTFSNPRALFSSLSDLSLQFPITRSIPCAFWHEYGFRLLVDLLTPSHPQSAFALPFLEALFKAHDDSFESLSFLGSFDPRFFFEAAFAASIYHDPPNLPLWKTLISITEHLIHHTSSELHTANLRDLSPLCDSSPSDFHFFESLLETPRLAALFGFDKSFLYSHPFHCDTSIVTWFDSLHGSRLLEIHYPSWKTLSTREWISYFNDFLYSIDYDRDRLIECGILQSRFMAPAIPYQSPHLAQSFSSCRSFIDVFLQTYDWSTYDFSSSLRQWATLIDTAHEAELFQASLSSFSQSSAFPSTLKRL